MLFVLTTFVPYAPSRAEAARYFSAEEIDDGLRYAFQRRLFFWTSVALQLTLLGVLALTGAGRRLADFCDRLTGKRWLLTVLLVGGVCFLAQTALELPVRVGRLENARAWGMTHRSLGDWLEDYLKWLGISALIGGVVLLGLYVLVRLWPRWWWAPATVGGAALGITYAFLLPLVINPLFNIFTPLQDEYLRRGTEDLARKAGVPVSEILVMDASRQGKHSNAYFTGFGASRQIVLYDNLLKSANSLQPAGAASVVGLLGSPGGGPLLAATVVMNERRQGLEEVESVLAHEMGHWRHNHILKGISLGILGGLLGMFVLSRILLWAVQRRPFLLHGPADPAGVPFVMLLAVLGSWLASPVESSITRYFEREADAASLELAGRPEAFIAAEKRLCRDNKSDVAPTPWTVLLFSTHPTALERIQMAEEYRATQRR
jgi:STE24 endopeptidase